MLFVFSYYLYLIAGTDACNIHSDSELVKYSLYKSSGQVVRDLSGNNYHGINGSSLSSETADVIWTDRGAYFDESQYITLGNTLVSENPILLSRNFTLVVWLRPMNNAGYIFGSNTSLRLNYNNNNVVNSYLDTKQRTPISGGYRGKVYLDKWGMFSLILKYFPDKGIATSVYNQNVYPENSVSGYWEDSPQSNHIIGKRSIFVKGFMYDFTIYDEPLLPSVFTSNNLFVSSSPICDGYPASLEQCLPEVADPLMNSQNQVCQCNGNSCRSDPNDCIECECGLSCSLSPPYSCLNFESEFCSPYVFDASSFACDETNCSEGFFWAQDSCSSSCPSGFYGNSSTKMCEECDRSCLECEGTPSYCVSCPDSNSFASEGTCVCSGGFFAISSDPLLCCSKTCTTCEEDSSCTQCIKNAFIQNGNCVCNSGYFLDSSFDCEKCGSHCLECEEGGCLKCESNMTLESKECVFEEEEEDEDEILGYFSIFAELKDDRRIELKSEEKVILTKELIRLEERPYNKTVNFKIESEDSLIFMIEFELSENFLEDEDFLDLTFAENIQSLENNSLKTTKYSFQLQFSVDRSYSSGEIASISGFLCVFFTSFVAMITLNEPTALWTVSRTAQYISYLPLLNIDMSDSCYKFFRTYNTALFIPNLGVEYIERTETVAPNQFRKFGLLNKEFEDTNVLRNSARFLVLFVGVYCLIVFLCVMSYVLPCDFAKKKRDILRRKTFGCLILLWVRLGLDFLMYSSVTLFSDDKDVLSNLMMNTIFFIGNVSPLVLYLLILNNEEGLRSKDEKTMNYLDSLVEGIRLESKQGIFYEVFMGIRNLVYVYTMPSLCEIPIVFCGIQLIVSALFFVFMIICKVFKTKTFLVTNLLGEVCLSVLFIGLISIKGVESEDERNPIEFIMKAVCVAFILFASVASIVAGISKKCKRKEKNGDRLPPAKVQPFGKERYEDECFQQRLFHFFEPGAPKLPVMNQEIIID